MIVLLQLTKLLSAESQQLSAYMHGKNELMQHALAQPAIED